MSRLRLYDTILNLFFSGNTKDDKSEKDCKLRSLGNHFH